MRGEWVGYLRSRVTHHAPRNTRNDAKGTKGFRGFRGLSDFRDPNALFVLRLPPAVADPSPADLQPHRGLADAEDRPILVAALREGCPWLVTFNVRHYQPGLPDVAVLRRLRMRTRTKVSTSKTD